MSHFCSMTRRQLFASFTAAATTASLGAVGAAQSAEAGGGASPAVILGNGEYRYQVVGNWGELPPGYTYGDSAAVCVDSKDNVYVFTRGSHPVIVFDRNGKFLRSWGEDIGFINAHGAAVGPDDVLYLTDDFGHAVRKCTTEGKVVLTIGTPKKPAPAFSGDPFNRSIRASRRLWAPSIVPASKDAEFRTIRNLNSPLHRQGLPLQRSF